jgi:hypothetical protein
MQKILKLEDLREETGFIRKIVVFSHPLKTSPLSPLLFMRGERGEVRFPLP